MSEPFLAEVKLVSFGFPPKGWAQCNGQLLPINQNQALFSLLGTTYGGDGRVTFALPDLRGRVPVHFGQSILLGEKAGQENHTLIAAEMPEHTHQMVASNLPPNRESATNNFMSGSSNNSFTNSAASTTLNPQSVTAVGGSQPHNNMQPFLTLNFIIALQGIFPSQS